MDEPGSELGGKEQVLLNIYCLFLAKTGAGFYGMDSPLLSFPLSRLMSHWSLGT